jgi:hypothetical protein
MGRDPPNDFICSVGYATQISFITDIPCCKAEGLAFQAARQEGQQARSEGRPLSANPYGTAVWGRGRAWKEGWDSVEKQIRWIERHRA